MRKTKKYLAALLAMCTVAGTAACGGNESLPTDVPNGDFEELTEDGKWLGWTREDAAFNVRGIVANEEQNGAPMEKSGNQYFSGAEGGNPAMRGTLTSDPFKLGGTGVITFKMGGNAAAVKVCLADGTEVCYYQQTRFNDANFPSVGAGGSWADIV